MLSSPRKRLPVQQLKSTAKVLDLRSMLVEAIDRSIC